MPAAPHWTLEGDIARLELGSYHATIDLTEPGRGLANWEHEGESLGEMRLLAVCWPHPAGPEFRPLDAYVRQSDLVATYAPAADAPWRVQVYWRASVMPEAFCIDLQISVQTHLLDSAPEVIASSVLPVAPRPSPDAGCLLFRLGPATAYAEMIQPADAQCSRLRSAEGTATALERVLFAERLEKGVILRARVRGLLTSGDFGDGELTEAYRAFLAEPPPLTT